MPEQPLSMDQRVAYQLVDDDYRTAKLMSQEYTPPPNARPVSEARELELWNQVDPTFDEQAAWMQHIAQGTDPWVAKTDIALKKYPNRKAMMEQGRPRVREQIAYANARAADAERAPRPPLPDVSAGFPVTPGPVPIPMPRAAPMPADPAVSAPMAEMPREPMQRIAQQATAPRPPSTETPY